MIKTIKILLIEAMDKQILRELNFVVGAAHSTNLFIAEYSNNQNWA